ncbi:MAG: hypothetical protein ACPIOQ_83490, partial [Promethearchaeia archaeon]
MRVLFKDMLSRHRADDSRQGVDIESLEEQVKTAKLAKDDAVVGEFRIVRLVSCGITALNLSDWVPLFLLCQRLVLADSKMNRSTLKTLRQRLQQASAGWFSLAHGWLPFFFIDCMWAILRLRREKAVSFIHLKALDFIETKQVPPDVLVELMRTAFDLNVVCRVGKRPDFRFFRDKILQYIEQNERADMGSAARLGKEDMQAIATRSGKG